VDARNGDTKILHVRLFWCAITIIGGTIGECISESSNVYSDEFDH